MKFRRQKMPSHIYYFQDILLRFCQRIHFLRLFFSVVAESYSIWFDQRLLRRLKFSVTLPIGNIHWSEYVYVCLRTKSSFGCDYWNCQWQTHPYVLQRILDHPRSGHMNIIRMSNVSLSRIVESLMLVMKISFLFYSEMNTNACDEQRDEIPHKLRIRKQCITHDPSVWSSMIIWSSKKRKFASIDECAIWNSRPCGASHFIQRMIQKFTNKLWYHVHRIKF